MDEKKISLLQIRLPPSTRKEFKRLCLGKGLSESSYTRMLILEAIEREKQKRPFK